VTDPTGVVHLTQYYKNFSLPLEGVGEKKR
jgi:hypothetical protein